MGVKYYDQCVCMPICLSVCLLVRSHVSRTTCPNVTKFSVHVNCGHGSVLLWRQCSILCTSGFVDNATMGIITITTKITVWLWTLAPRSCTARVLGRTASAVSPTHRWCGRAVAGGRWVEQPHWAPNAIGAPGRLGCRPCTALHRWCIIIFYFNIAVHVNW